MTDEARPSPDALLLQTKQEGRGRLKIFLGAAPGVGKTYEMLSQARQRKLEGADVVIGVVETHGRVETDLLTKSIEKIPKKRIPYKGRVLAEMDLDAILQRRPKLVLVDELAHTNVEGSRHPKRYMDVEELLAAGIDVNSTLNVQHLESLNDVVAKITRVRVSETVPDSILDRADDVELVDLTPDDLLQRLKEGKVYFAEAAERAAQNYFVPGNLTALRELALRRTAQRVDDQMVSYMRAHAIQGPWEASERVLVCVNERPGVAALVRYTRRLADRLHASWAAIHVDTPAAKRFSEAERDRVADALRVAERLGGQAVSIPAASVAGGVIDYARANNFTHIVTSTAQRGFWREIIRGSAAHEIIRRAGDISVHVVPEQLTRAMKGTAARRTPQTAVTQRFAWDGKGYTASLGMVVAALLIGLLLQRYGITNVALVFLTAVLTVAITYGLWPSLFACIVATLAYNFFFLPPLYTFTIADPENVVALFFFTVVAIIASYLSARVRTQAISARERAATTESLYLFSRKLAGVFTLDDLLWAASFQFAQMLKVRVVILLPEDKTIAVRAGYPPEDTLVEADIAAAKWVWEHASAAGRGADTLPGAKRLFLPMRTGRGMIGVVGLDSDRPGPLLTPEQRRLFDALSDQVALAVERIRLSEDIERTRMSAETERLRAALLTSISHDLRTPLASILGSITSLRTNRHSLGETAQEELSATIQEEAERLNRFIANLLDMTRLESGAIEPRLEDVDVGDVVGSALRRAGSVLSKHHVEVNVAAEMPSIKVDPVLFEQVLFNLLDNAAKYSAAGTGIHIAALRDGHRVRLEVRDEGDGIPDADVERIFDKFYRVQAADRKRAGTGLGLPICRGFVEALGGMIVAGNRADRRGAVFTIMLPANIDQPYDRAA
ncbi:MAG TPA: sensor histidine kinase KdpD [Rhizomicrobium sp.]|jgi:two-component system sensor histidine kinase KdpD|nr:sensor histidine kinase KdpD [Rhizomicrobium sp.]